MIRGYLAVLLLSGGLAFAQAATGPPETVLAGINIRAMKTSDVQKLYGQQDAVYAVPPDPYPVGTKLYRWGRLTLTLKVMTEPSPAGEAIRAIEIAGEGEPQDKPINKTGRGLKLGAKSTDVKKLYGVDAANGLATIKWSDGTTLLITANDKGRVSKLELRAP